jgi:putative transcriptional regulator
LKRSTRLPARYQGASAADLILLGLKDILAYERGQISLRTTTYPIPSAAPAFNPGAVTRIRTRLHMSQAMFALYLNVPTRTLQSWEHGSRQPKAGEARLLQFAAADPALFARIMLGLNGSQKPAPTPKQVLPRRSSRVSRKSSGTRKTAARRVARPKRG